MAKAKTAKAATKTTGNTKTRKRSKSKKAILDKNNKKTTVKQTVKSQREIKYRYPTEVDNQLDRKAWRQKTRNTNKQFLARISKMKAENSSKLGKEEIKYRKFRKENYMVA